MEPHDFNNTHLGLHLVQILDPPHCKPAQSSASYFTSVAVIPSHTVTYSLLSSLIDELTNTELECGVLFQCLMVRFTEYHHIIEP